MSRINAAIRCLLGQSVISRVTLENDPPKLSCERHLYFIDSSLMGDSVILNGNMIMMQDDKNNKGITGLYFPDSAQGG